MQKEYQHRRLVANSVFTVVSRIVFPKLGIKVRNKDAEEAANVKQ